jgi:hypothetical protein
MRGPIDLSYDDGDDWPGERAAGSSEIADDGFPADALDIGPGVSGIDNGCTIVESESEFGQDVSDVLADPPCTATREGESASHIPGERADDITEERDTNLEGDGWASSGLSPEQVEAAEKEFGDLIRGVRLVYSAWDEKIVGIGTWQPESWTWEITPVRSAADCLYWEVGIDFLTTTTAQEADCAAAMPTGEDRVTADVSTVANPASLLVKLCNVAVQGVALHLQMKLMAARLVGSLVAQVLSPVIDPTNRLSPAVKALQIVDVTADVATGHLTPAVYSLAAGEANALLKSKTRGITQAELDQIEEAITRGIAVGRTSTTVR